MRIVAALNDRTGLAQPLHLRNHAAVGRSVVKIARHAQPRLALGPADIRRGRRQDILPRPQLQFARHGVKGARQTGALIAAAGAIAPAWLAPAALPELESVAIAALLQNLLGLEPSCRRHFYDHLNADALLAATCKWRRPSKSILAADRLKLGDYLFIDFEKVAEDLAPRVDTYAEGLGRIEEKEGVLGGEAVFKNTRLSVNHIGKLRDGGEAIGTIIEDYPYLRQGDVEFARLYYQAHPIVGRPRRHEEIGLAGNPSPR